MLIFCLKKRTIPGNSLVFMIENSINHVDKPTNLPKKRPIGDFQSILIEKVYEKG